MTGLENNLMMTNTLTTRGHCTIDTHLLNYIVERGLYFTVQVTPVTANIYAGDFHGLLKSLDTPDKLLNLTTILNNLYSATAYAGTQTTIRLINAETVKKIISDIY